MGGLRWGRDLSVGGDAGIAKSTLPSTFTAYSDNNGNNYYTFVRSNNTNLVFFADGGLWSSLPSNESYNNQGPFAIDITTGAPRSRSYGTGGAVVNNSMLFGNLITWAMTVCPNKDLK
jgi:hypothetical protein